MQCIWLLDSSFQVWRCSNELNHNVFNWDLRKVSVASSVGFNAFFKPAMTYDDFFLTSHLQNLRCFSETGFQAVQNRDFLFASSQSATKHVFVYQPKFNIDLDQLREEKELFMKK